MIIHAPFTEAQVESLKTWQQNGLVHPFTCCDAIILIPDKNGMHCDDCGMTQTWVHDFMANGKWSK